jgi:hypothetical protein
MSLKCVWPRRPPNVNVHAQRETSAPESQSTVSTLSTFSSQSTSANRCPFHHLRCGVTLARIVPLRVIYERDTEKEFRHYNRGTQRPTLVQNTETQ